jgi:hypothetical protein
MQVTANRRFELAAPCWVLINLGRLIGGDARHRRAVGDGEAPAGRC